MTPGNGSQRVAVVRSAIDALNRGDWDMALANAAPEFEYDLTRTDSPLRGVYSRDEMRGVTEEFLGSWESVRYEPHDFIEQGDRVVTPFTTHFSGRDGIEIASRAAWVWTFRGASVVRVSLFQHADEALAAAAASDG